MTTSCTRQGLIITHRHHAECRFHIMNDKLHDLLYIYYMAFKLPVFIWFHCTSETLHPECHSTAILIHGSSRARADMSDMTPINVTNEWRDDMVSFCGQPILSVRSNYSTIRFDLPYWMWSIRN